MQLVGQIAESPQDVESIRLIRNAGRSWMTGDTAEIREERQRAWWASMLAVPRADFLPIVYRLVDDVGSLVVGYGILSRRGGRLFISLAVDPAHHGCGYGTAIYRDLGARTTEPIYAEILRSNMPSQRAAERAGFRFLENRRDTIIYERHP